MAMFIHMCVFNFYVLLSNSKVKEIMWVSRRYCNTGPTRDRGGASP